MRNLFFALFLFLPFFASAQTKTIESITTTQHISNNKLIDTVIVITVDWVAQSLQIGSEVQKFETTKTMVNEYEEKIYISTETGQKLILLRDTEGLRGVRCEFFNIIFDVEITDIWAEMKNFEN